MTANDLIEKKCPACNGTGIAKIGFPVSRCMVCNGTGEVVV